MAPSSATGSSATPLHRGRPPATSSSRRLRPELLTRRHRFGCDAFRMTRKQGGCITSQELRKRKPATPRARSPTSCNPTDHCHLTTQEIAKDRRPPSSANILPMTPRNLNPLKTIRVTAIELARAPRLALARVGPEIRPFARVLTERPYLVPYQTHPDSNQGPIELD